MNLFGLHLPESASDSFGSHLASYLPTSISDNPGFLSAIAEEIRGWEELASEAASQARKERLKLSQSASDLRERLVLDEDGKLIVAGVRFKNLDLNFPFIALYANFSLDCATIQRLALRLKSEFKAVRPLGFTFDQAPGSVQGIPVWSHVVFGRQLNQSASLPGELKITWPLSFAHYTEYRDEYIRHLDKVPGLKGFVRIEPEKDLQTAAEKGLLLQVEDEKGNFLGIIAGQEQKLYGLQCLYIFEIFLCERVQGRGYAPNLQRSFLQHLHSRFSYVWGNIHDHNSPSLKTAQRAGRKIIQSEFFFPLT
jgi:hypothetical protein